VNGENLDVAEVLSSQRTGVLRKFLSGYDFLFVDEAQKIPNIGANLKLIVDTIPETTVFVTGSSAFDLNRKIGEPFNRKGAELYALPFCPNRVKRRLSANKRKP
jgi:uncharacterized protein